MVSSDAALRLFLGEPSRDAIAAMLPMLELPYPIGLMTPPVSSPRTRRSRWVGDRARALMAQQTRPLTEWLSTAPYHGSDVWVWQQSMMELGLMQQIGRLKGDPTAADLVKRMRNVVEALHTAASNAGELANAELYTFNDDGKTVAFGQAMGSDTEANAVQLWSTVGPAVHLARQRLATESIF